eukprot:579212-Pyramimonas_sp.AAC.1
MCIRDRRDAHPEGPAGQAKRAACAGRRRGCRGNGREEAAAGARTKQRGRTRKTSLGYSGRTAARS